MRFLLALLLTVVLFCSGCALKVVPEPTANGVIDTHTNSQTITRDNISITVRNDEAELDSYNLANFVTTFAVEVDNNSASELALTPDSFLLVDDQNRQYSVLTPDAVKQIVTKDSYYLLPYPYVGFYYLEDYERASFKNRYSSNLPYYYEIYPQDIYTKALRPVTLIPKAKANGLLYFGVDVANLKEVKILMYKKSTPRSAAPDFSFPFRIEK